MNETITCLHRIEKSYNKSTDENAFVKVAHKIELDALFGLTYFKGLLGMNLRSRYRYFYQTATLFLVLPNRKIVFDFSEAIFALTMQNKDLNSGRIIVLPPWDKFGSYSILIWVFWVSQYLSIDEALYLMRHQIAFCWYNLKKPYRYGLL